MSLMTLTDLLKEQVLDIYSAEKQVEQALPNMISAASSDRLREALQEHLQQTHEQVDRLRQVIGKLGVTAEEKFCKGMAGLIEEGSDIAHQQADDDVRDAALIAAAQRVEHYEIASYGTACAYADQVGLDDIHDLLGKTLKEEKNTDDKLTKLATGGLFSSGINKRASHPGERA